MSEPNIQTGGWELGIAPRASLALTFAATALLHTYVETRPADSQAHGWRMSVWPGQDTDRVDRDLPPIGPGKPATIEVTRQIPGELQSAGQFHVRFGQTPYARDFDRDPAVQEIDQNAVSVLQQVVDQMRQEGYGNITLSLQGLASAEDATRDGLAGVQTPSDDNIRTADARRDSLYKYLQSDPELLPSGINIKLLPGAEGELDDAQIERLRSYAEQFGYGPRDEMSGVEAMIDDWELNPQSVPPEVDEDLQLLLGGMNRGVMVVVSATKHVPGQETTKTEPELVCMVPVQPTETHYLVTKWSKGTIPWIIPVIVPYPRRRRERFEYPDESFYGYSRFGAGGGTGTAGTEPSASYPVAERPPALPRTPRERHRWPLAFIPIILLAGGLALNYCDFDDPKPIPPPTNDACAADLRVVTQPTDTTKVITFLDGRRVSTEYR